MTVDELLQPLSVEECRDHIYGELAARGANVSTWKQGAVVRTIIYALAVMAAAFSRLQVMLARSAFLDHATGAWLTLVARFVYGVTRLDGAFATGTIEAANAGGGIYTLDPGDLIVRRTGDVEKEYRNTELVTIGANDTVVIAVRAVEVGADSSANAGTITEMTTPLPGVTVTNPVALVGADPETDEQLRVRCRASLGALSPNGPKEAYSYVATTAMRADGSAIGVTRVHTVPDGYGTVDVYVATASGGVTGSAGDAATDLGIISRDIKSKVEPIGVTADVQSATPKAIDVTYEVWVRRGSLTDTQIEDGIEDSLREWVGAVRIGGQVLTGESQGYIRASAVEAAISRALNDTPVRIEVTVPAGDVSIADNEAPVLGVVTATAIHQITEVA